MVGLDFDGVYLDGFRVNEPFVIITGYWKSYIINMMNLTDFYEDTESQANIIKKNCLNCKLHKVVNGKYIGEW